MRSLVILGVLALAATAGAETFLKWRTPDGTLYIGESPPEGSVLLESIDFPDRSDPTTEDLVARRDAQASAAADGREIMQRRAGEREADRERRARVVGEIVTHEPERSTVIVTHHPDHLFDFVPPGGVARSLRDEGIGSVRRVPAPVVGPPLPPSRPGQTALVPPRDPPRKVLPRFAPLREKPRASGAAKHSHPGKGRFAIR